MKSAGLAHECVRMKALRTFFLTQLFLQLLVHVKYLPPRVNKDSFHQVQHNVHRENAEADEVNGRDDEGKILVHVHGQGSVRLDHDLVPVRGSKNLKHQHQGGAEVGERGKRSQSIDGIGRRIA